MWTPDTTTQSRLIGGQALAAGISGGTKSLADSIGAAMEQRKQENVRAKASETLFKSTPELQDALGIDEEQFKGLSSAEKNELVKSGIGKISLMESLARQAQQREAFNMQQIDYSRRQADELGFNRAVGEQMAGGKPPDISAVLGAAAQNNQLGSPQLDNLMNSLSRAQPKAEFDPTRAFPIQGREGYGVVQTSAGQYQVLPPDKADEEKEPMITLAQGEPDLLGRYPNSVRVTPSQYKKHKAALDEVFKRVPDKTAPAAGNPLPMPKTKNELTKGQTYQTARGVALWDGTKFIAK